MQIILKFGSNKTKGPKTGYPKIGSCHLGVKFATKHKLCNKSVIKLIFNVKFELGEIIDKDMEMIKDRMICVQHA